MPSRNVAGRQTAQSEPPLVLTCAADNSYAMPLAVMLFSALKNYSGGQRVETYILDAGISGFNQQRISRVLAPFNLCLHWINPRVDKVRLLPPQKTTTYYRLLIPELLPQTITRALYLDSDVLVTGDLALLWEKDVRTWYFLAAQDTFIRLLELSPLASHPELRFNPGDEYFNAGVLLMNLTKLREDAVAAKVIDFCRKWPEMIRYKDQDGLNAVAIGNWGKLDGNWNRLVRSGYIHRGGAILHYVSRGSKPWLVSEKSTRYDTQDIALAHTLYDEYAKASGWFTRSGWFRYSVLHLYFGYILARQYYRLRRKLGRLFGRILTIRRRAFTHDL